MKAQFSVLSFDISSVKKSERSKQEQYELIRSFQPVDVAVSFAHFSLFLELEVKRLQKSNFT